MKNECEKNKDKIADYISGVLPDNEAKELQQHLNECAACNEYARVLTDEDKLLNGLFSEIDSDMAARQERVLQVIKRPSQSGQDETISIWRIIMKKPITKIAAAAVILIAISMFSLFNQEQKPNIFNDFSFLAKACAAENYLFTGENIVHIQNEIIVFAPAESSDELDFAWLPMCSLKSDGQFMFNQLRLPVYEEPYTVYDDAWYEPETGKFIRILKTDEKVVFANSYDGEFVYTSQVNPDGTFQLVGEAVTEDFTPPLKPAEFLGMGAGMRSGIQEDDTQVQGVTEETLEDGSSVRVYKVGTPDPFGQLRAYWFFRVRDDDGTIAEKEFVISDETRLLIRRVLAESVLTAEYSWNLGELEGLDVTADVGPQVSLMPDMIVLDISIERMVESADFETYIFAVNPSWAEPIQIMMLDLDMLSPGERLFIFAARADDGRHLVMVQSPIYDMVLGPLAKTGTLVYTSPNGFKVWGGGPTKWYAEILLNSARSVIKDTPSDDRVGYILESPAGTYPALAINGPLSDEELHELIDTLIPAKDYIEQ